MKRVTLALVVLNLVCAMMAVGLFAIAEEPEVLTSGDYMYIVLDDGTAEISSYRGSADHITVPEDLAGFKVTSIGGAAFSYKSSLTSVTIPDSVTSIGSNPFEYCESLNEVIVSPDHPALATIDGVLFSKSDKRLVWYPITKTNVSYTIPQGISSIGDFAFEGCQNLTSVIIPDSVTSIGGGAFTSCSSLTSVSIPDSVTSIGSNPFTRCESLNEVIVSPDHPALATIDGVLFCKYDARLVWYPMTKSNTSYTIPQGISSIGDYAFYGCSSLTSVTIPDSVTSIGRYAFNNCSSLTSVSIPDSVTSIGDFAFYGCSSLTSVSIPDSVISIGYGTFAYCDNLTLTVSRNSYAAQYCEQKQLKYTYPDSLDWLNN